MRKLTNKQKGILGIIIIGTAFIFFMLGQMFAQYNMFQLLNHI